MKASLRNVYGTTAQHRNADRAPSAVPRRWGIGVYCRGRKLRNFGRLDRPVWVWSGVINRRAFLVRFFQRKRTLSGSRPGAPPRAALALSKLSATSPLGPCAGSAQSDLDGRRPNGHIAVGQCGRAGPRADDGRFDFCVLWTGGV